MKTRKRKTKKMSGGGLELNALDLKAYKDVYEKLDLFMYIKIGLGREFAYAGSSELFWSKLKKKDERLSDTMTKLKNGASLKTPFTSNVIEEFINVNEQDVLEIFYILYRENFAESALSYAGKIFLKKMIGKDGLNKILTGFIELLKLLILRKPEQGTEAEAESNDSPFPKIPPTRTSATPFTLSQQSDKIKDFQIIITASAQKVNEFPRTKDAEGIFINEEIDKLIQQGVNKHLKEGLLNSWKSQIEIDHKTYSHLSDEWWWGMKGGAALVKEDLESSLRAMSIFRENKFENILECLDLEIDKKLFYNTTITVGKEEQPYLIKLFYGSMNVFLETDDKVKKYLETLKQSDSSGGLTNKKTQSKRKRKRKQKGTKGTKQKGKKKGSATRKRRR